MLEEDLSHHRLRPRAPPRGRRFRLVRSKLAGLEEATHSLRLNIWRAARSACNLLLCTEAGWRAADASLMLVPLLVP
jgi:hypothetical protein